MAKSRVLPQSWVGESIGITKKLNSFNIVINEEVQGSSGILSLILKSPATMLGNVMNERDVKRSEKSPAQSEKESDDGLQMQTRMNGWESLHFTARYFLQIS